MKTTLYKISFSDGRMFKVFCANRKQKERMRNSFESIRNLGGKMEIADNGIHNIKQWEAIIKSEINK